MTDDAWAVRPDQTFRHYLTGRQLLRIDAGKSFWSLPEEVESVFHHFIQHRRKSTATKAAPPTLSTYLSSVIFTPIQLERCALISGHSPTGKNRVCFVIPKPIPSSISIWADHPPTKIAAFGGHRHKLARERGHMPASRLHYRHPDYAAATPQDIVECSPERGLGQAAGVCAYKGMPSRQFYRPAHARRHLRIVPALGVPTLRGRASGACCLPVDVPCRVRRLF